jgi:hypothetical protein
VLGLWIHALLIVVVLVGIAWRRRSRATLAFPLYLAFSVACCALQLAAAIDSEDWLPWLLLDLAQRILALCVAVEIAARIFHRDIPGGRTYTGRVFVVVLGLGLVAALLWGRVLLGSVSDRELYFALVEGGRRVALTSATAFALLGLAVVTVFDWHLDPITVTWARASSCTSGSTCWRRPGRAASSWSRPRSGRFGCTGRCCCCGPGPPGARWTGSA